MMNTIKPKKIQAIHDLVHQAAASIAPVWPLQTFIACNALQGFETQDFEQALFEAHTLFEQPDQDYQHINRETIKWCSLFFDEGQSVLDLPYRCMGLYAAFKALAIFDKKLHQGSKKHLHWLKNAPQSAEEAIVNCFEVLNIAQENQLRFLKQSLAQLPGWSGYIKWQVQWQNTNENHAHRLVDFVAIRLMIAHLLHHTEPMPVNLARYFATPAQPFLTTIKKHENHYRAHLLPQIVNEAQKMSSLALKPGQVQLVFCIDVRSEPFRRHLESTGPYETFGFAGFFGLAIRFQDYNTGKVADSCPVLLKPRHDLHDAPTHPHGALEKQHQQGKTILEGFKQIYQQLKYNFATPFALVETLGAWCGLLMLFKTMQPMLTFATLLAWRERIQPTVPTIPQMDQSPTDHIHGISTTDQALYAETVLRIMGLTDRFGKVVIFCGHGSQTQNNPYASGLNCGACGGHHGGHNASVLARILNQHDIRQALCQRGIHIPEDTLFLAAEHNTTTDDLCLWSDPTQPALHQPILQKLKEDLKKTKAKNTAERTHAFDVLDHANPINETRQRSQDWSEVRPEWGLARNAAFIIGPRTLTKDLDLEGRCFLHSYEWEKDEQLSALETILTAPMIVAEWINTQYLFSTLNNVAYGSGSKITHNVTGKIGVMQGNSSDLMHGLPLQSVNSTDDHPYHQPQRLLTVIYAPKDHVQTIISRQDILKTLFYHGWVHLIVIDPCDKKAYQLQTNKEWCLVINQESKAHHDPINTETLVSI